MNKESKQTTKECPNCGNENLVMIGTQQLKMCSDCGKDIPWFLDEGQKSPLANITGGNRKDDNE